MWFEKPREVSHDLAVIAHMCGRVLVMLQKGETHHPYSKQLFEASYL